MRDRSRQEKGRDQLTHRRWKELFEEMDVKCGRKKTKKRRRCGEREVGNGRIRCRRNGRKDCRNDWMERKICRDGHRRE